jgi:hypothetical protein
VRDFFDPETLATAFKGMVGVGAATGGFYVSIFPRIEAWLRLVSLLIGIAVGIASFISIIRKKKQKP